MDARAQQELYSIKNELGDENPIDISFCIECVKMAILDYKEILNTKWSVNTCLLFLRQTRSILSSIRLHS